MKIVKYYFVALIASAAIVSCYQTDIFEGENSNIILEIGAFSREFIVSEASKKGASPEQTDEQVNAILVDTSAGMESYANDGDINKAYSVAISASAGISGGDLPDNPGGNVDNPLNAYDYTGKYHVDILREKLTNGKNFVFPNGEFDYARSITFTLKSLSKRNVNIALADLPSASEFGAFYNQLLSTLEASDNKLSNFVKYLEHGSKITGEESQILVHYFQAQENARSLNAFIAYSLQVEKMVAESQSLSFKSKELLLFSMATARHDVNFWNPY